MKVLKTKLEGVKKIILDPFVDYRGEYVEIYNLNGWENTANYVKFVQDDISVSRKNVIRGIHGDKDTWKLVSCLHGEFYLVVVDCDVQSNKFAFWEGFIMSDKRREQILIPPLYGNAHLVMSDSAIFHYKQSSYYQGQENQFTYHFDEPLFNIKWPVRREDVILSKRDMEVETIEESCNKLMKERDEKTS
tara:strand:- start:15989 stop:16558 length:570 start_codon:yes stop_codon:yes gene_type:complete